MNNNEHNCPICGKPTSTYMGNARNDRLCREHAKDLKDNKIIRNEDGTYSPNFIIHNIPKYQEIKKMNSSNEVIKTEVIKINENTKKLNETNKCIICEKETENSYLLCKDCYYDCLITETEMDKNISYSEIRDYYFNLNNYAERIYDENVLKSSYKKMYVLANLLLKIYNNYDLIKRTENDIKKIKESKILRNKKLEEKYQNQADIEKIKNSHDQNIPGTCKTADAHWVKSDLEKQVDNILYDLRYPHVYEKTVTQITERTVKSDWFIPIINNRKGIYIELWGIKGKEEYDANKEEKLELYHKHEISLIEITPEDIHADTKQLTDKIEKQVEKYREILQKQEK